MKINKMKRNKMEKLPPEILCLIFSFVPLESLIRMRSISRWWKNFIEENLKHFYNCVRRRNSKIPQKVFGKNFITNTKKYKIGLDWIERNEILEFLHNSTEQERFNYLISNQVPVNISSILSQEDLENVERYLFLKNRNECHYMCHTLSFSELDDMDFYRFLFLRRKGECPFTSQRLLNISERQLAKFIFLREKGECPCQARNLLNLSDKQIGTYFYLRNKGIYPYSAKRASEAFDDDKILKFVYLVEKGISTYRAESIVAKINEEKFLRFLNCIDMGLTEEEASDLINKLTKDETLKFLNLKSEGISELNSLLIIDIKL